MENTMDTPRQHDETTPRKAAIRRADALLWKQFPGHFGQALSKEIVSRETLGSEHLDYRLSCYEPGAYVARHSHRRQEQIYHILRGRGLVILDGRETPVGPDDVIFIPPFVEHELHCTGTDELVLLVITSPQSDD
jgi:quercetin dioxygenase-like cupin family protein